MKLNEGKASGTRNNEGEASGINNEGEASGRGGIRDKDY